MRIRVTGMAVAGRRKIFYRLSMHKNTSLSLLRLSLLAGAAALSSCQPLSSLFHEKPHKIAHVKALKRQKPVNADSYVENLSLAQLGLDTNQEDFDAVSGNVSVVKAYAAQKHGRAQVLTLAVIDYKTKGGTLHQALAPADRAGGDFALLPPIMAKLDAAGVTLQNIHLVSANIAPDASLVMPDDAAQILALLTQLQARILEQSANLPAEEDIRTQLALMDFFTRKNCRDAAYLTLDNVKHALAAAAQNNSIDEATLKTLSARLEYQEGTLKTQLPYRF